jgi:purine nucleosidase
MRPSIFCLLSLLVCSAAGGQTRYVIADQDASGPGGSDMASLLVFLQSPKVDLLGITVVTGDSWRDTEVAHALRLLETVGRTDVKVYPGAAFPLVRTQEETALLGQMYGSTTWMGAWNPKAPAQRWDEVLPLREGAPLTGPAEEDAAHFMVRMVHLHPHQVTIYAAGPLTNVALAIRLDPHFAELAQELIAMGGSVNPQTDNPEWIDAPRHEFNFWFDPEAAHIVLTAPWAKVTLTTVDASIETHLRGVLARMAGSANPAARYLVEYAHKGEVADYAWDELAAATWLDPAITRKSRDLYLDVNLDHGAGYGDLLTWSDDDKPRLPVRKAHVQIDVDAARLEGDLAELFMAATPHAADARALPAR